MNDYKIGKLIIMPYYVMKIKRQNLKELVILYKKYSAYDSINKANFITEPMIKTMFRDFESQIIKEKHNEGVY
jgi:hypothetical protein